MKLRPQSLTALAALALVSSLATSAMAADERKPYIVQLNDEPAATYAGTVEGLAATRVATGTRFNFQAPEVQAYVGYLDGKQQNVMTQVGNAPVTARYNTVFNGFAALLTDAEVAALRSNPQVVSVHVDEARKPDTISSSKFLGLSLPGGLWSQTAGGNANQGEGVIIGVIDTGIWPENLAFADKVDANGKPTFGEGTQAFGPAPAGWAGSCQVGSGFTAAHCNNKLIGARYFNAGFKAAGNALHWTEFADSPRDSLGGNTGHGGHGTHTASTAGGNGGNAVVQGGVLLGEASGMAPRARIAAYKICWTFMSPTAPDGSGSANTCYNSDSVSAIDRAVQDGVHVINYSISGSQTSVNDPVEQAFLKAAKAGIFVAASAGNSGPANQVAHISPWLTTVAASTHDRQFQGDVVLGTGASYRGASLNGAALPAAPLISSISAKAASASEADANLCMLGTLDPAKVSGKIVVCLRGTNARVEKSLAVANAGGVGMVMQDTGNAPGGLVAEAHAVPTVHLTNSDGALVRSYAAAASPTAALSAFYLGTQPAPVMAGFSSRGPNMGDANVLKPDLTAPGVDVIAGVSAALNQQEKLQLVAGSLVPPAPFASYQGTSMSSPHVAGIAALLRQAHPGWSPAAIKSALMTTTMSTLDDGLPGAQNGLLPWAQGAGHVVPNKATDPGLVYDSGAADWTRYQCKVNKAAVSPASDCTSVGTLDETYNLNLPSITVGALQGPVTVTRRVTNVGATSATYTASASLPDFTTVVTPASLTLAPGETQSFTVRLSPNASAPQAVWRFGSLSWTDGTHVVRSPVSARVGLSIIAPDEFSGTTTSGSRLISLRTGFAGKMTAGKAGMKEASLAAPVSLAPAQLDPDQLKAACEAGADTANVKVHHFSVPAGAAVAGFGLRGADASASDDDHDIGLLGPDGSWTYSGNEFSDEFVQVGSPAAGNYKVCVVAFAGSASSMTHQLSSWIVTPADTGGKLTVMVPAKVYSGGTATAGISWSGLETGKRYLGAAQFKDAGGVVRATTALRVDPGAVTMQSVKPRTPSARELSSKLD